MEQNGNQHTILNLSDINLTETSENNYKWQKLREITEKSGSYPERTNLRHRILNA